MKIEDLKLAARGRWLSIFSALGIQVPEPPGKQGPCPICRDGTDRFSLDKNHEDGTWFCRQCERQSGDGIGLVQKVLGLSFPDAIKKVSEIVGVVPRDKPVQTKEYDRRRALNRLWRSSTSLTGADHVSKYLRSRGLVLSPHYVRFCPTCYESETKTEMPAMVAQFLGPDGKALTIHRTYLNGIGKADIKSPKKLMPVTAQLNGGAIRLFPALDKTIGVAEGIETAIAVTQLYSVPCWAVVSSTLMQSFVPPEGIRRVVVFGDRDATFVGQEAAYRLAHRLYALGLVVDVELPESGKDFNDVLMAEKVRT